MNCGWLLALEGAGGYLLASGKKQDPRFNCTLMDIHYKIIGGDDIEYGPTSLAELKSWIHDGRVAAMTKVWRSDLSNWSRADRYTELLEDLARLNARAAAAVDAAAPAVGFWARLAAFIIDYLFIMLLVCMIWTPLAASQHWQLPPMPAVPATISQASTQQYLNAVSAWSDKAPSSLLVTFVLVYMLYEVFLIGRFGATFGKMAIRAKVIMIDGSPIGYHRALLRWIGAWLSQISLVGYIPLLFRRDKRALHDLLVGTKVVFRR